MHRCDAQCKVLEFWVSNVWFERLNFCLSLSVMANGCWSLVGFADRPRFAGAGLFEAKPWP